MRSLGNERVRRQAAASQNVRGFSEEEKIILLEKHNALRQIPGASNMNYMVSILFIPLFFFSWP